MPANRPATERTQSVRPLFSWMTSTPPRGVRRLRPRRLQFALRPGPGDRRRWRSAFSMPGGGALAVAGALDVTGAFDVPVLLVASLHAAISAVAAAVLDPEQRQPAQGLASGQQAVDVIGGDFFGDVAL